MDEDIMGKVFRQAAPGLIAFVFFLVVCSASLIEASDREDELFVLAYEHYLSYKPEKAIEEFRAFLKEFPESSARDAALFWLGASLLQVNSLDEAQSVYLQLKHECPQSPLVPHMEGRILEANRKDDVSPKAPNTVPVSEAKPSKDDNQDTRINELQLSLVRADEKNRELSMENERLARDLSGLLREKESLEAQLSLVEKKAEAQVTELNNVQEKMVQEAETLRAEREHLLKKTEELKREVPVSVTVRKKKYSAADIAQFVFVSSAVSRKMGHKELLWRTGDAWEDFIAEAVLSEEAEKASVSIDGKRIEDEEVTYGLNAEEKKYLVRMRKIGGLLDQVLASVPSGGAIEAMIVRYTDGDKYRKIMISPELQTKAKDGIPFDDIRKAYPELIELKTVGIEELEAEVKDRIGDLHPDQIGVKWSEEGYAIFKPAQRKVTLDLIEEMVPEEKTRMKRLLSGWIDRLKESYICPGEKCMSGASPKTVDAKYYFGN